MNPKKHTNYGGTYFDKDSVLLLERWARWISWGILASYIIDVLFSLYQSLTNTILLGFPPDYYFTLVTLFRVLQGGLAFIILQVAAKVLLILLDIEDNTRRAARAATPAEKH
jgi:hypothetical protein